MRARTRNLAAAVVHRVWAFANQVGAISRDDALGRRFRAFGAGSCLSFPPGAVFGERWITIGDDVLVGPLTSIAAGLFNEPIEAERDAIIMIGDRCNIGRSCHIVGRVGITISDDVTTGPNVYITDHNHSYAHVGVPIGQQWLVEDTVSIGAGSWLGAGVVVLPGARIGAHVTVAAGSIVRGELPDRCVAVGSPAKVVRQWIDGEGWVPALRHGDIRGPGDWPGNPPWPIRDPDQRP